jgi:hypothetical protein
MKTTTVIVFLMSVIALSSFNMVTANDTGVSSSTQLATLALKAFQHTSADEYTALLPTFNDLSSVMDQNTRLYGAHLDEAKSDFASTYLSVFVPSVRESFNATIAQGKKIGIHWESVEMKDPRIEYHSEKEFFVATVSIDFNSAGKQYTLSIDKAIVINGKWTVSQYVTVERN